MLSEVKREKEEREGGREGGVKGREGGRKEEKKGGRMKSFSSLSFPILLYSFSSTLISLLE